MEGRYVFSEITFNIIIVVVVKEGLSTILENAIFRCLNITRNESWLDLDQEDLKRSISGWTWGQSLMSLVLTVLATIIGYYYQLNYDMFNLSLIANFSLILLALFRSTHFYFQIFMFARKQNNNEQPPAVGPNITAELSAVQAAAARQAPPSLSINLSHQNQSQFSGSHLTGSSSYQNPFDDTSDDEDLLEPAEAPSAKQASAVFQAGKTMIVLLFVHVSCIILLTLNSLPNVTKYACVATLLCLVRFPGKLVICTLNFRPIRNTVSLYVENLPNHIQDLFENVIDSLSTFRASSPNDDQRSIVVESQEERTSPVMNEGARLNMMGKRESATNSPSNSNDSLGELPAVQC